MPADKRSFKRFNLFIVVEFRPLDTRVEPFWGITRNFSDEGFSFESQEFSIEKGGILECTFKQSEKQLMVSITGKIVWKEEADKFECLTGVKFQDMNEERKDKLLAIMSAAGELPSGLFPVTGKTEVPAAIPEDHLSSREEVEILPEEPAIEHESVCLDETVGPAKKSASEKKAGKTESIIPFLIPVTVFIIGAILFVVIKQYDEGFMDMFSYFRQTPSVERFEVRHKESVDESPLNDTIVSSEQSDPAESIVTEENETPLPGPEEISGIDRNDDGMASLLNNKTKPPIFFTEEFMNAEKKTVRPPESDKLTAAPESENELVKEGLINNILEARKSVEINQKQPDEENVSEKAVNEKPVSTIETGAENEASGSEEDESAPVTVVMSDGIDNEQTETLPDPPAAETESLTVAALPESTIDSMKGVKVFAETPVEAADNQTGRDIAAELKENVESRSSALIFTGKKKEEKIVEYEETFNDNDNKWDLFNTIVASAQIKDGEYRVENKRVSGLHFVFNEYGFPHDSDFTIEVDIKKERRSKGAYGFALGASDAFNNHVILIDGKKFNLIRYRNGVPRKLTSVAIGRGIIKTRSFNRLKIEKSGDNIRLYINNFFIHEVLNISFNGDKIGFVVGGRTRISVDKIYSQITSYE